MTGREVRPTVQQLSWTRRVPASYVARFRSSLPPLPPLDKFQKNTARRERYLVHLLATLVLSLLLTNGIIRFWPMPETDYSGVTFDTRGQETIQVEEIQQTQQEKRTPPPPVPAPPVVVPDDVVLDDIELEVSDVALDTNQGGVDTENVEGTSTGSDNPARADRSPSPVRIATPDYPREAERRNIRAEVVVEVLVDERGRVEKARIVKRILLNKDGSEKESVQQIGYGIEESALSAAERHTFRPAIQGGQRVKSYSTLTFRIGIDS